MFDQSDLILLLTTAMPYGKYQGRAIIDLPEEYLLWMNQQGMPAGQLGHLLGLALELKIHGLEDVLQPLREHHQLPNITLNNSDTKH